MRQLARRFAGKKPGPRWPRALLAAIQLLALAACGSGAPAATPELTSLDSFVAALESATGSGKRAEVSAFWDALVAAERVPFVMGEDVAFLFRGKARSVDWVGDFTDWQRGRPLEGSRAGESDIWVAYASFPKDARLEYRIVVDGRDGILDPANPVEQWGGFGPNSVVAMPDYAFPREVIPRDGVPAGQLSEPTAIDSTNLGYRVNFQVYTPSGYETLDGLAVLYATDAHEYADPRMGSLPIVLDNLIADGAIEPILAVLVDPRDPKTGENRRVSELVANPAYAAFLAEELVPLVDSTYKTDPDPDRRAILGASYGGLNAAYCGLAYPEVWHLVAMQSPAFVDDTLYRAYESAAVLPRKVFLSAGYPWDLDARTIRGVLEKEGVPLMVMEVPEGHSWGQWRAQLDDLLLYFFPASE